MPRGVWNVAAVVVAILLLAGVGPWFAEQLRSLPSGQHLAARSGQRIVSLEIIGMTGTGDADAARRALLRVAGVSACEVRIAQRRAYIVLDANRPDSTLVNAVHELDKRWLARLVTP